MNKIEMICVQCPVGCKLEVILDENKNITDINGNKCDRGEDYAIQEIQDPKRIVPTNVKVENGELELVSVKTDKPVSKDIIWDIMKVVKSKSVQAPVNIGDIIIENILDTDVNIVATKEIKTKK